MFSAADVAAVRHVVQRILVPCVFVIGLLGNSVSIYVLTRKRMRCTTNIYLTALAITDIIYLTMALLLSLKHYDYVQQHVEIYWKCYGYVVWLCDACAYISIYIAVCFTIERFIAIRYPLKRQTFCTESLAKKVITGVVLFCLFSTISTAFEHQYRIGTKSIDIHGNPCNLTQAKASEEWLSLQQLNYNESARQQQQQLQMQRRQEAEQDDEQQNTSKQLSTSTTTMPPYNDFEGSGQVVADERTEQRHHRWQTRATTATAAAATIGAVVRKEDNLDNGRSEEVAGNVDENNSNSGGQLKPDVILRRLNRTVDTKQATVVATVTTLLPLLSKRSPLPALATPSPTPPAALITGNTVTLEWSALATTMKATTSSTLKSSSLKPADSNIPSIVASYLTAVDRQHTEHLLDTEFLVSAGFTLLTNGGRNKRSAEGGVQEDFISHQPLAGTAVEWTTQTQASQADDANYFNQTDDCEEVTFYENALSSLAENALYTRLWYFFTLFVFVLMPLCLLATFNCFLIMLVRRSKNLRGEMTNANSIRRSRMSSKGPRKSLSSSVSQENRITVTLIAVVLLFIVCQLPWAIYLIVSENVDIDGKAQAIIGNIFNFLAAINAAANFFLYCVLSDKYRKTVRELITGYKYRAYARNTSATASLYTSTQHASQMLNGSRRYRPSTMVK